MSTPSFGIYYIATGRSYVAEAAKNATISKSFNPNILISISTDDYLYASTFKIFDSIRLIPDPTYSYRDKILGLLSLPYDHTLFLDTDACLIHPLSEHYNLLSSFDIACCHAPVRHPPGHYDKIVPQYFPELNSGVIFLKRIKPIQFLMTCWLDLYDSWFLHYQQTWDQASFRSVLWYSICSHNLTHYILPSEFNLRTTKPWIAGRGMPVYVVHGRFNDSEMSYLINYLNGDVDCFRTSDLWYQLYPDTSVRPRFDRTYS